MGLFNKLKSHIKNTKLFDACIKGDIAKVKHLVVNGANINKKNKDNKGWTPLMYACEKKTRRCSKIFNGTWGKYK